MKAKRFKLWTWVENGGDGSAHARFTVTEESASKKDEAQIEDGGAGWGESSVGSCTLEYEDGKLYLVGSAFDAKAKRYVEFRHELQEAK